MTGNRMEVPREKINSTFYFQHNLIIYINLSHFYGDILVQIWSSSDQPYYENVNIV